MTPSSSLPAHQKCGNPNPRRTKLREGGRHEPQLQAIRPRAATELTDLTRRRGRTDALAGKGSLVFTIMLLLINSGEGKARCEYRSEKYKFEVLCPQIDVRG